MARRPSNTGALAGMLLVLGAACVQAQTYSLQQLRPADVNALETRLDTSQLPEGASRPKVVPNQAFRVQTAGRTEVIVLPVQFSTAAPGMVPGIERRTELCGVYVADATGKARFTPLADNDTDGAVQCGGAEGVGLAHGTGAHPQVLLLFRVHTVHRSWSDPYAVSWSDSDGRYVMEHLSAPAGVQSRGSLTIAQLRRWVSAGR